MSNQQDNPSRKKLNQESLPLPPTPSASIAGRTMQESVYKRREQPRRLPEDAPNILIVLIDDAGPGLPATFGGEVHTPNIDRIAREGALFTDYYAQQSCTAHCVASFSFSGSAWERSTVEPADSAVPGRASDRGRSGP